MDLSLLSSRVDPNHLPHSRQSQTFDWASSWIQRPSSLVVNLLRLRQA